MEDVLAAASLFQFAEIETASCEFLKDQLDVTNCLGIEAFASLHGKTPARGSELYDSTSVPEKDVP